MNNYNLAKRLRSAVGGWLPLSLILAFLIIFPGVAPASGAANVVTVKNTNDSGPGSLRRAVSDLGGSSGTIVFDESLAGQTIRLSNQIWVDAEVTIDGQDRDVTISGDSNGDGSGDTRIFKMNVPVTIKNLNLEKGYADSGGCIKSRYLEVIGCQISQCEATYDGGAIFIENSGPNSVLKNSKIDGNKAGNNGGGVYGGARLQVRNSEITNNSAGAAGGGLVMWDGILEYSLVAGNRAEIGGGGGVLGGRKISHSKILDNWSKFSGGGVSRAELVEYSEISGNETQCWGGGLENVGKLSHSTVANNYGRCGGGGLYINLQSSHVTNSTFFDNESYNGGGLIAHNDITVINSTFFDNTAYTANTGGGIFAEKKHHLALINTIVAGNTHEDCVYDGTLSSIGNLIQDGTCSPALTDDPKLGPLQDNGGFTETMALLEGSKAIDAGDDGSCETIDQRGMDRPQGVGCDIGAFELAQDYDEYLERIALVTLFINTDGDNWLNNTGWLDGAVHHCEWFGVTCDAGHVVNLDLSSNGLNGPIPPELGSLSNLEELWLGRNDLSGSIPPELGTLSNLGVLWLSENQLSGSIPPELGSLSELETLGLQFNDLSGSIPPELVNLSNLTYLWLGDNQLSGSIPPELGSMSELFELELSWNQLSGPIPPELGSLSNLDSLYLQVNDLSGSIPAELGSLSELSELHLSSNQLTCWETQSVLDWAYAATYGYWDYPYPGDVVCSDSCPVVHGNLVENYCFEDGPSPWLFFTNGRGSYMPTSADPYQGQFAADVTIEQAGSNVQFNQKDISLKPNTAYELLFAAYSTNGRDLSVYLHKHSAPYTNYGLNYFVVDLDSGWDVYKTTFTTRGFASPVDDGRLRFWMAPYDANDMTYRIDWVILREVDEGNPPIPADPPVIIPGPGECADNPHNIIRNPGFEDGTANWLFHTNGAGSFSIADNDPYECESNALVSISQPGRNVQLYQKNLSLQPGETYQLRLAGRSSGRQDVGLYLHKQSPPYTNYGLNGVVLDLTSDWQVFVVEFRANVSAPVNDARLRLWLAPYDEANISYEFDDVVLLPKSLASPAAALLTDGTATGDLEQSISALSGVAADSVIKQGYFLDGDEAGRLGGGYVPENGESWCYNARPSRNTLLPANGKPATVRILGVGRPKKVTITGITQDEEVGPQRDAYGVGGSKARLRRERDIDGDGRVYHIAFTAHYRKRECSHEVVVTVPPDRRTPATDSGERHNSAVKTP